MRTRHFAYRTEQIYLHWIQRYVKFHDRRHPRELGHEGVEKFLSHLAVEAKVGASTQNQALQALLFLYRQVLDVDLPWLQNVTRASRPKRLPVVLTPSEVRSVLAQLEGTTWLVANLLYGSVLRLMESLRLRVKDVVMERCELIVRDAKGGKDRVTVLPGTILHALTVHLQKLHVRFEQQRAAGAPGVSLPPALMRKYPNASTQWGWQYVFPADSYCKDVYSGHPVRHHIHERTIQRAVQAAVRSAGILQPRVATCFGIALPRTCWRRGMTFVRSRNCWAMPTFAPPCSIRTSSERA
jgi:integron integrase